MGHFKKDFGSLTGIITTECEFVTPDLKGRIKVNSAMWDTGSEATILSRQLVSQLQPEAFRHGGITGIGGDTSGNTYLLHVYLPTGDVVTYHEVYEANIDYDAIIGMDIITLGDFHIDSSKGETSFTFSLPNE